MSRLYFCVLVAASALLAGCGGGASTDPTQSVPKTGGLQQRIRGASAPQRATFPKVKARTLQQVADSVGASGASVALASSQIDVGTDRLAFGVIDDQGQPVYGQTAVYVAPRPNKRAAGPFLAPADVLLTQPRYRSKQAALAGDPFAAVYAAQVSFPRPGKWDVLVTTLHGGKLSAATAQVDVSPASADPIPRVGEHAPKVETDTMADARGNVANIDTRIPPDDMHKVSFSDVVGKKPVALLFATPQLCQSRVCGPVTDIAVQMEAKYGRRMAFIHQEVYKDNNPRRGLREPLIRFHLRTEPWLFVVNRQGIITARLEGSIGVRAFEQAIKTGL
jgi:uncharacterized MAPEG superfamily protein